MRISDWSSDVCSSDLTGAGDRRRLTSHSIVVEAAPIGAVSVYGTSAEAATVPSAIPGNVSSAAKFCGCRHIACRSEEHTSELQSLMRISYAVFCLKKKNKTHNLLTTTRPIRNQNPKQ